MPYQLSVTAVCFTQVNSICNICSRQHLSEMGSDQSAVRSLFGCVLLLNQIYLTMCRSTIPLRFIWSVCYVN